MKKLLALLLVLVITASCMTSCDMLSGIFGGGSSGGGNTDDGGETPDENDSPAIEEDDGDVDVKDNIDPDGWTKVEK